MHRLSIAFFATISFAANLPIQNPAPTNEAPRGAKAGKAAPHFRVNDETGSLTKVGGPTKNKHWTVLAFYPKASTGG